MRLNVELETDLYKDLKIDAARNGVTITDIITTMLIDKYRIAPVIGNNEVALGKPGKTATEKKIKETVKKCPHGIILGIGYCKRGCT